MKEDQIREEYFELLRQYITDRNETVLAEAADLGRRMLLEEYPPEELAEIHQEAVSRLGKAMPELTLKEAGGDLSAPFLEMLMAHGLFFREQQERRRMEEQIEMLFHAVNHSQVIVTVADASGKIVYANPMFTRVTGFDSEEVLGRTPRKYLFGDIPPQRFNEIWRRIVEEGEWRGEFENARKDGGSFWGETAGSRVGKKAGQIVLVTEDITARKETEAVLKRAKEAAEEANCAKSEFLANMSHEIRTPMTVTLGMLEFLLETDLTDQQRECVEMAKKSADSLLAIINGILDFSSIEARKLELHEESLDLRLFVREIVDILRVEAERQDLDLLLEVGEDVPRKILADPVRLRQVIVNLLGNALKFTEKGSIRVRIGLSAATPGGDQQILFSVIDSGAGIPQEKLKAIFEPFIQADGSFTRRFGGTGLGLAICRELVERMGGSIQAESRTGAGSVFSFTLPLKED